MKQDIENTTKLLIALIAVLYFAIGESKAGDVSTYNANQTTQVSANQTYQANQSNVGNTTEYNQKYSNENSGNYTGNSWTNANTTVQQNINASQQTNINNSKQSNYVDTSETDIKNIYNDTSGSNNELKAYGGDGGDSNSKSYATAGSNSASMTSGDTTVKTGSVNVNTPVAINNNQVRQHRIVPFAFSPGMAMSFSQDNCSNSASLGVSTGIFGVSGGVPIGSDDCNRRKDVQMWLATQQPRIACERMIQSEENAAAMKAAGLDCNRLTAPVVAPVVVPSTLDVPAPATYDKWTRQNGIILDKVAAKNLSK